MRDDSMGDLRRFSWRMAGGIGAFAGGCYALTFTVSPGAINPALAATAVALLVAVLAWRTPRDEPAREVAAPQHASDGTEWRVQGFLLPQVTGQPTDVPYAPIFLDSEPEARQACTQLYRSHAPGMVRVEIERIG